MLQHLSCSTVCFSVCFLILSGLDTVFFLFFSLDYILNYYLFLFVVADTKDFMVDYWERAKTLMKHFQP